MTTIIETRGLTKYFGDLIALDSVDIKCQEGITAILGPNGAGKTTLIRILLGLIRPSSGTAYFFERNCFKEAEIIHQSIGVLHEKPTFPENFTTSQFLQLVCQFYEVSEISQKIDDILQIVDLTEHKTRKIGTFSAGMTQRLGIAQALISNPRFVILDEPMANLDPISRISILDIIHNVWRNRGTSFLVLSHDLYYLEQISTHAIFINEGRILQSGLLKDLFAKFKLDLITIESSQVERVYEIIKDLKSVSSVELDKANKINCEVKDLTNFQKEFFKLALEKEFFIKSLQVHSEKLEQLYRKIIGDGN